MSPYNERKCLSIEVNFVPGKIFLTNLTEDEFGVRNARRSKGMATLGNGHGAQPKGTQGGHLTSEFRLRRKGQLCWL